MLSFLGFMVSETGLCCFTCLIRVVLLDYFDYCWFWFEVIVDCQFSWVGCWLDLVLRGLLCCFV